MNSHKSFQLEYIDSYLNAHRQSSFDLNSEAAERKKHIASSSKRFCTLRMKHTLIRNDVIDLHIARVINNRFLLRFAFLRYFCYSKNVFRACSIFFNCMSKGHLVKCQLSYLPLSYINTHMSVMMLFVNFQYLSDSPLINFLILLLLLLCDTR